MVLWSRFTSDRMEFVILVFFKNGVCQFLFFKNDGLSQLKFGVYMIAFAGKQYVQHKFVTLHLLALHFSTGFTRNSSVGFNLEQGE